MKTSGYNTKSENGSGRVAAVSVLANGSDPGEALPARGRQRTAGSLQRILRIRAHRTAGDSGRILTRRQVARLSSWEDLQLEVRRSRRYGHVLSVVRLAAQLRQGRAPGVQAAARRDELDRIALAIRGLLRKLDHVWTDGEDIYLLLPEGGRAAAERLLDRVGEPLAALVPDAGIAIATFPEDGLSTGALLAALARPDRSVGSVPGGVDVNRGSPRLARRPEPTLDAGA